MQTNRQGTIPHYRIGEAKNPGPHWNSKNQKLNQKKNKNVPKEDADIIKVDFINISHIINNAETLIARDFDVAFVNEHSIPKQEHYRAKNLFGNQYRIQLSKLDPEKSHNVGGVGIVQNGTCFE